jgi:PhnB protein
MPVQPIPDGYHSVTPYLICADAATAIDFYKKAFAAVELLRLGGPDGKIGHAEIRIGNSIIMLADEHPEFLQKAPTAYGGSPVSMVIYVPNVDEVFHQAIAAGGKEVRPLTDQFYGDRTGSLIDPFGHTWTIMTHVEDVPQDEVERRLAAMTTH